MKTKFYGFAIATLMAGALASCSNDVKEPAIDIQPEEDLTVSLVHAPDFYAWSGKQILGDTRSAGTRAEDEGEDVVLQGCGCPEGCEMCENFCDEITNWCECQKIHHNDEVEVNLTINDVHMNLNGEKQKYDHADLWTKLSIHVRKGTDVKVVIPLPNTYIVESDDLAIIEKHIEKNGKLDGIYSGTDTEFIREKLKENTDHQIEYNVVDNYNVTLTLSFTNEGIVVETAGINDEIIDYLWKKNGDGINFEVWNYFQTETVSWALETKDNEVKGKLSEAQYDEFQDLLHHSTIQFLDFLPGYYINAFTQTEDGTQNPWDCKVKPNPNHHGGDTYREAGVPMEHLNGSPFNIVYYSENIINPDDAHKDHSVVVEE